MAEEGLRMDDRLRTTAPWYLATPYSKWPSGIEDASRVACIWAAKLIRAGIPVFSPIAHSHAIAVAAAIDPYSHDIWIPADRPFWAILHGLLVADLPGWRESKGVGIEIEWFRSNGKPAWLLREDLRVDELG